MGLAGNKKRSKISADPNNTAWAKSTTGFGHKMLAKQGWKPGDFLGAENASHSDHYTAANASHIRVMLREDNLGIGAKVGTQNAETFGLSMFSGLLGRLNGNEQDQAVIKKKEETIRDVQLKLKYGNMNFVSGGLLVGDKMHEVQTDLGHLKGGEVVAVKENKKRKAGSDGSEDEKAAKKRKNAEKKKANGTAAAIKEMKRQRKLEAGGDVSSTSDPPEQEAGSSSSSSSSEDEKAAKRRRKAERKARKDFGQSAGEVSKDEKARLKEEKRARKEERRKRKEEKRAKRAAKEAKTSTQPSSAVASESEAQSGTSTPTFMGGRQAVRHRYIMQKRMAAGSAQALKEIFMMKPQVAS
ncbi:Putative G-patch domain-containing protein [Septoria linicola]|uniref:PinX1-related protein 1 n=1 Tax=Septoria linicola TaxID=215465 RepID=A0A9Q9B5P4_9PEZI|nr:putative G-patch domain-containing protein [Septoria linicola]USW57621.1 Putative G-patch domain-containing protein [Septoria linicola]